MKHYLAILCIPLLLAVSGCGGEDTSLEGKKDKLSALQKQLEDLKTNIHDLEKEIAEMDTTEKEPPGRLVTTMPLKKKDFKHYIELQGTAESKGEIDISAEVGGKVEKIMVDEGNKVSAGQVLIQLDDALIIKQIEELKTALVLADTVYRRQKKLWDQRIGSEIQYLEAKNNYEGLQNKLATANEQLSKTRIKSPINGTVDAIYINEGEMAGAGRSLLKVVNLNNVKVVADVSEKYIRSVNKGDSVSVRFPALGIERNSVVSAVGQVINPVNRTFRLEVELPNKDNQLKANLLAVIKVVDYEHDDVVTVPTALVQRADHIDFVYVVDKKEEMQVARKVKIETGKSYNGETEVLAGLTPQDVMINKGSRECTDGEQIRINNNL